MPARPWAGHGRPVWLWLGDPGGSACPTPVAHYGAIADRAWPDGVRENLAGAFLGGALTVDAMLRRYCTLAFAQTGSYEGAARRLGIDRRTVKEKVDPALLEQLTAAGTRRQDRAASPD